MGISVNLLIVTRRPARSVWSGTCPFGISGFRLHNSIEPGESASQGPASSMVVTVSYKESQRVVRTLAGGDLETVKQ